MFAVLVTSTRFRLALFKKEWDAIIQKVIKRLASGIPDKIKVFTVSLIPISVPDSSESLVVIAPYGIYGQIESLMLNILNKRWQTLDLISMMEELKRSLCNSVGWEGALITDRLSSRPRFKKEEDLTDCA